jgi:hypothetical protein
MAWYSVKALVNKVASHEDVLCAKLNSTLWKTYGKVEVQLHVFLTSALDGSEWSASRLDRFIPVEESTVHIG